MSAENVAAKFQNLSVRVTPELAKAVRSKVAGDLVAMVKQRWLTEGKTATGQTLYYKSAAYRKYKLSIRKGSPTFKDFMLTGAMWKGVKVKSVRPKGTGRIEIVYGPTDTETANKISGHNEREGTNILWPSPDEIMWVRDNVKNLILEELKKAMRG